MQQPQDQQQQQLSGISSTKSKYIESIDIDVRIQFKNMLFAEISKLDDSVDDETKEKWYLESLRLYIDITKINIFLLSVAFIIRNRVRIEEKRNKKRALETGDRNSDYKISTEELASLIGLYSSKYKPKASGSPANVSTDIYKYFKHITSK